VNEDFVKSLYKSIVKENLKQYKILYETTDTKKITNGYMRKTIGLYSSLEEENKEILFKIIEQTMIDTISNMLGVIDGSSTLIDCRIVPKLLLDSIDTEGELQDCFLKYIEDMD
jgi:hypothetical protein